MVGRVKSGFIDTWLNDKSKGDNYVVISLWLVTFLAHCLAFNKLLKTALFLHHY